ncbi:PIG-L family deacetylase [Burkholderia glumae]|uniref:PIG-L family deacetylase n=1 Tax=Burkholderia glumae TaxID=337 RepID=UPI002150A619|nr:PIG-L family deacetylase [Burkholderia glumae]UVS96093.1 GlcNAc-PI de-N-acetylase [Burkholderia glumae]
MSAVPRRGRPGFEPPRGAAGTMPAGRRAWSRTGAAAVRAALDARAPLFVVSPHLDDAVFGCASLLATRPGTVVCTVFAGLPAPPQCRPWDAAGGFADSTAALRERIREDDEALRICGARGLRLPFLDGQYGPPPGQHALARALAAQLARCPGAVPLVPLGLHHPDHRCVADAWQLLARRQRRRAWLVYEEAIHRGVPGVTAARLHRLERAGWRLTPLRAGWSAARGGEPARAVRRRAIAAYASQLRAFGDARLADLDAPERYWLAERRARTR